MSAEPFKGNKFEGHYREGGQVQVTVRDLGVRTRFLRERHYECYTTQFKFDGRTHYSRTDRAMADTSGDILAFRISEDRNALERLGIRGII